MIDETVSARVNLFGLLKALELLPEVDPVSQDLIQDRRLLIEFRVPRVGRARLRIAEGSVQLRAAGVYAQAPEALPPPAVSAAQKAFAPARAKGVPAVTEVPAVTDVSKCAPDVVLAFTSPGHFNGMVTGTKQPIPLKGLRHLGFLKGPFGQFTGRLEYYLRPSGDHSTNPEFTDASTRLTAYVAFHALSQIANYDGVAHKNARNIPDGVIQVKVLNDIGLFVRARGGTLATGVGDHTRPRCVLWFKDLKSMGEVLAGKLNTYDGIALGRMGMRGFIPMIDYLNPVLGRIPAYLQ